MTGYGLWTAWRVVYEKSSKQNSDGFVDGVKDCSDVAIN